MTRPGFLPGPSSRHAGASPPGGTRTATCRASALSNSSSCCYGRASTECSSKRLLVDAVHAPAKGVDPPACAVPPVDVEAIAAVDNDFRAHRRGKGVRIELHALAPFRE